MSWKPRAARLAATLAWCSVVLIAGIGAPAARGQHSVARQWNEETLDAIRNDFARPTVHARNLYHSSVATWDAWSAYDPVAEAVLHHEKLTATDVEAAREEAISYAAYRLLSWRFAGSPGAAETLPALDARMDALGYDRAFTSTAGDSPAALGNRIAATIVAHGLGDGANEAGDYENLFVEVRQDQGGAQGGEPLGNRSTDSSSGTGDQRPFSTQATHRPPPSSARVETPRRR